MELRERPLDGRVGLLGRVEVVLIEVADGGHVLHGKLVAVVSETETGPVVLGLLNKI